MPRRLRATTGGIIYHVLNRGVGRMFLFKEPADYHAFEQVLAEAHERYRARLLAYCLMPNHWHLVLWPREDGELSEFMRWLTVTHTQRWHAHRGTAGTGPVYQGRFKSFPVQSDAHVLALTRYVERNPLRAKLVRRAEDWRWSSLWRRVRGTHEEQHILSQWPVEIPRQWLRHVNQAETESELAALRQCARRGSPYGSDGWQARTVLRLGLESTLRPRGRPRKNVRS